MRKNKLSFQIINNFSNFLMNGSLSYLKYNDSRAFYSEVANANSQKKKVVERGGDWSDSGQKRYIEKEIEKVINTFHPFAY
jgi:hypothetical protein